jgi:hypothetical protein
MQLNQGHCAAGMWVGQRTFIRCRLLMVSCHRAKGYSEPTFPVRAERAFGQERIARFSHPGHKGGPDLVIAPWNGVGRGVLWAADIPPIRSDTPNETQARLGLQRGRPTSGTRGIEACLFLLFGRAEFMDKVLSLKL